jgi:hypothetical protein
MLPAHQKAIAVTTVIPLSIHPDPERLARRRARLLGGSSEACPKPAGSAHALARVIAGAPAQAPALLPDTATTIALALHWVRRRGRRLSALPELIRSQLEQLSEAGDPAARLVRDWLAGCGLAVVSLNPDDQATADRGGVNDAG